MTPTKSTFGLTLDQRLKDMGIRLIPASSRASGDNMLIYALDYETGQPLTDEKALDLRELLHEFAIEHNPHNPANTLISVYYGASSAVMQLAIDQSSMDDFSIPLSREMTPEERDQYYRLLVYDVRRWEYIMDEKRPHIRADLQDLVRPLKHVLDHLNRLEIDYHVEHIGHTDMLIIPDTESALKILTVRNSFYEKIVGRHPEAVDMAKALIETHKSLPNNNSGGEGDKGK